MKKLTFMLMLAVVMIGLSGISFGETTGPHEKAKEGHAGRMMEKAGLHEMKYMDAMMMKKMTTRGMVATSDGGVVVMAGNTLMKYDKDLNLVKETEIKIDMEALMRKMKECKEMMHKSHSDEPTK